MKKTIPCIAFSYVLIACIALRNACYVTSACTTVSLSFIAVVEVYPSTIGPQCCCIHDLEPPYCWTSGSQMTCSVPEGMHPGNCCWHGCLTQPALLSCSSPHPQVGKHLEDVSQVLPLRCVCREWREVATLGAVEATLDLEPRLKDPSDSSTAKEQLFFKACPQLRKLTYHVSPWVPLAQVSQLYGHGHVV